MLVWASYWLEDCCMGAARGLISTLHTVDSKISRVILRTLNYGNYGIFLNMGNAGFIASTVPLSFGALGCSLLGQRVFGVLLAVGRKDFRVEFVAFGFYGFGCLRV